MFPAVVIFWGKNTRKHSERAHHGRVYCWMCSVVSHRVPPLKQSHQKALIEIQVLNAVAVPSENHIHTRTLLRTYIHTSTGSVVPCVGKIASEGKIPLRNYRVVKQNGRERREEKNSVSISVRS